MKCCLDGEGAQSVCAVGGDVAGDFGVRVEEVGERVGEREGVEGAVVRWRGRGA